MTENEQLTRRECPRAARSLSRRGRKRPPRIRCEPGNGWLVALSEQLYSPGSESGALAA